MNRVILQLVAVGFCFALGQALQCYQCKLGLWDLCLTTEVTCKAEEHCYTGVGHAVGFVDVTRRGCLEVLKCNQTTEFRFPGIESNSTVYQMTKTCCNTDLCNAAPGLPGSPVLSLTLATITALFLANVLV